MTRTVSILASLALLCSCDPRAFDDVADTTWVHSTGKPDGTNSDVYAVALAGTAQVNGDSTDGVRLVTVGDENASIGMLDYGSSGSLHTAGARIQGDLTTEAVISTLNIGQRPPAFAGAPDGSGNFALGMPGHEDINGNIIGAIFLGKTGTAVTGIKGLSTKDADALGRALAYGNLGGAGGADLVAIGINQLVLYTDPAEPNAALHLCTIDRERGYAVATGDFMPSSAGDEILVMGGNQTLLTGTPPVVHLVSPQTIIDADPDDTVHQCFADARAPLATLEAPNSEADFGLVLVVGDFDGGGVPDVAISATSANKVYVFMNVNLDDGMPGTPLEIAGPTEAGSFATSMAAGDLDNDGQDELLIGAPATTVEGAANAGMALLYQHDSGSFTEVWRLHDAQPEKEKQFGRAVTIAPFTRGASVVGAVIAIAAEGEVFTYFRTPFSAELRQ